MPHGLTACLKVIFENLFLAMAGPGLIKILLSSDVGTVSVGEVCAAFASYSNKAAFPPGQIADLDTAIIAVCDDLYPEHCAHFSHNSAFNAVAVKPSERSRFLFLTHFWLSMPKVVPLI